MKKHIVRYVIWILTAGFAPLCFGQTIRIRVVDVQTERPPKATISISLLYDKSDKTPPHFDAVLSLKTDEKGESQFSLPEPAPVHFSCTGASCNWALALCLHGPSEHTRLDSEWNHGFAFQ
jgi:hypothetical protein